jgi:hypothetical protein
MDQWNLINFGSNSGTTVRILGYVIEYFFQIHE